MLRRSLVPVLLVVACVLAGLGAILLALRASGPVVRPFGLGTAEVQAGLSASGRLDAYVPVVDWGARAHPFGRPLAIDVEFRALDRDAAVAAARSGRAADANIEAAKGELRSAIDAALLRAAAAALLGGVLGGFLAGAVIVAAGRRRRWLLVGTVSGLASSLALTGLAGVSLARANWSDLRQPTFYAHGAELPELLSFSEQILEAGESYTRSYEQALAGLANLVAFASEPPASTRATGSAVVASDLHLNTLVLPALEEHLPSDRHTPSHETRAGTSAAGRGAGVVVIAGRADAVVGVALVARVALVASAGRPAGAGLTVGAGGTLSGAGAAPGSRARPTTNPTPTTAHTTAIRTRGVISGSAPRG